MDGRLASTEKHAERPSAPRPGGQLLGHRPAGTPGEEERGSITPPTLRAYARDGDAPLPCGPHDLGLAPRDPILPRPEDAQGVKLGPELDPEDGRVPPPADPLAAPRAFEPERGEDRVWIRTLFIHSSVPIDHLAEGLFLCLLPSPHYARYAIRATLTLFCSTSHSGMTSSVKFGRPMRRPRHWFCRVLRETSDLCFCCCFVLLTGGELPRTPSTRSSQNSPSP